MLSWISTIYFEYGLHIQLVDQHCFLLGMGFTQIIQELPEANLYQLFTSPLLLSVWITHLRSQRDFFSPRRSFFFLCCFREGGETGQSAGHLLALPVPWPYGILGMYYSSLHSYNLPGFRLRQDRRENDYPRENTHKNIKYLTQTDQKLLHFTDESWKNNTLFWLMNTSELTWLESRIIPVWLQQPEAMKVNDLIWRGLPLSAARCKLNWSTHCTHIWCSVRTCTGTYVTFRHMFR